MVRIPINVHIPPESLAMICVGGMLIGAGAMALILRTRVSIPPSVLESLKPL